MHMIGGSNIALCFDASVSPSVNPQTSNLPTVGRLKKRYTEYRTATERLVIPMSVVTRPAFVMRFGSNAIRLATTSAGPPPNASYAQRQHRIKRRIPKMDTAARVL